MGQGPYSSGPAGAARLCMDEGIRSSKPVVVGSSPAGRATWLLNRGIDLGRRAASARRPSLPPIDLCLTLSGSRKPCRGADADALTHLVLTVNYGLTVQ